MVNFRSEEETQRIHFGAEHPADVQADVQVKYFGQAFHILENKHSVRTSMTRRCGRRLEECRSDFCCLQLHCQNVFVLEAVDSQQDCKNEPRFWWTVVVIVFWHGVPLDTNYYENNSPESFEEYEESSKPKLRPEGTLLNELHRNSVIVEKLVGTFL